MAIAATWSFKKAVIYSTIILVPRKKRGKYWNVTHYICAPMNALQFYGLQKFLFFFYLKFFRSSFANALPNFPTVILLCAKNSILLFKSLYPKQPITLPQPAVAVYSLHPLPNPLACSKITTSYIVIPP